MRPTRRPYLAFVGTHTRVVSARSADEARAKVVEQYRRRGFRLDATEVNVRLARRADLDWMRAAGANSIAERLDRPSLDRH